MEIDISNNKPICCICLENNDIKTCCFTDKIKHIPCKCNVYTHKFCFDKTDKSKCFICKQNYLIDIESDITLSWNNLSIENCSAFFKLFLKKKYTGIKISLQKISRIVEKRLIKLFNFSHFKHSTNNWLCVNFFCYCIYYLFFTIILIIGFIICFIIGGYYINAFICLLHPDIFEPKSCWLNPQNPMLYLWGFIGFPILICNITIFIICCCKDYLIPRRIVPYNYV